MAVRIRLARAGARKKPFYRVVVSDSRSPRDGRFIEIVGRYNPRTSPSLIELQLDRINEWIAKGATPSETVEKLIAIAQSPDASLPSTAKDSRPSKKAAAVAAVPEPEPAAPAETVDEPAADAEDSAASEAEPTEETAEEMPATEALEAGQSVDVEEGPSAEAEDA